MGLCRVDADRLRGLAARLGAQAVALQDVVPAAGLLALHGHDAAAATVAGRLADSGEWLRNWRRSLDERADLIDGMHYEATTPSFTTAQGWAHSRMRAAVATHLETTDAIADVMAEDIRIPAATLYRIVTGDGSPAAVAAFFAGLPSASAIRLAAGHPDLVGHLGGAPLPLRFLANGLRLEEALNRARRDARGPSASWAAQREVAALQALADRAPSLLLFDWPSGRLAEWVGPHDAAHVAVFVPGTGVDVWGYDRFSEQASRMVDHDPSGAGLAVVAALVYTPPPTVAHAALGGYADRGAPDLARFLSGLDLAGRHLSLIGHSYGSTVVGEAVRAGGFALDDGTDIVVLGSPGMRVDHVSELPVPAERVWVGLIPGDEIVLALHPRALPDVLRCNAGLAPPIQACDLGEWLIHGRNPARPGFGARVFPAEPAVGTTIEHTAYFSLDATGRPSPVLATILRIATADYPGRAPRLVPGQSLSPDP